MEVYKNVDITIIDAKRGEEEMSYRNLASIIAGSSKETVQKALTIVCEKDKKRIIEIAQSVHGILYHNYYRLLRQLGDSK